MFVCMSVSNEYLCVYVCMSGSEAVCMYVCMYVCMQEEEKKDKKLTRTKQNERYTRSTQTICLFSKRGDHNAKET